MSSADSARILRLKIGDKSVQDAGLSGAVKRGLRLALARAGRSFSELDIALVAMEEVELPLEAMVDALSEARSVVLTTGPKDRQGVAVMDTALIASVLEQVTTGTIRKSDPDERRPTKTDMIICAELLDAILNEISVEMMEIQQAPMISDFRYLRALTDPSGVELTLENDFYRLFRLKLDLGNGARQGELLLCFQAGSAVVGGNGPGRKRNWERDWREQVDNVPVRVQAIMHQTKMPLRQITGLKPGDLVELPRSRLEQVVLTGSNKKPVARGKLGRQGVNRAIRIIDVGGEESADAVEGTAFDEASVQQAAPVFEPPSGAEPTISPPLTGLNPVQPAPITNPIEPETVPMPMALPLGGGAET